MSAETFESGLTVRLPVHIANNLRTKLRVLIDQFKHMFYGLKKNHLNEKVLLSTHNICFRWEKRKILFQLSTNTDKEN